MDRFAAHLVATSALTAALAALPAAFGEPDSAQAAPLAPAAAAATSAAAGPVDPGGPMLPAAAPGAAAGHAAGPVPCPDARQVGATAHAYRHGEIAFSVKLFYSPSCRELYGYAYPWLQFRVQHVRYDLGVGVFDVTHDEIDGPHNFLSGAGGPDFWSEPVPATAHTCTEGLVHVYYPTDPDDETDTYTAMSCR
jgi:hypothetical protein